MTRIGKVTVKYERSDYYAPHYSPTVLQHVVENGEWKIAEFRFEKNVFRFEKSMLYIANQYRRAA